MTEYGLTGREAVDTARLHHQWLPDRATIEGPPTNTDANTGASTSVPAAVSNDVIEALRAKGHEVRTAGRQGDAHSICAPDGTPYGVNDSGPRTQSLRARAFDSACDATIGLS